MISERMAKSKTGISKAEVIILGSAAVVVILLLAFSVRTLIMFVVEPKQAGAARTETAPPTAENEATAMVHEAQSHEYVPASAPQSSSRTADGPSDFGVDFKIAAERKAARKEMIRALRKQAREDPEASSSMSEEQIRQLEQSNDSLR